ncbi:hypothetical protein CLG85_021865 [Yangia mangrovi]|uniref:Uncharacterized protein n=1 Tax=Alloyangia mangrovi TaxID=1779329 RepID=A0ABT2KTU9_9RHOB|nr:hypothetical protein [Alloyangia mangrovi]MCT4372807.1 hypothetical protein [Alloyangia mangrovi]
MQVTPQACSPPLSQTLIGRAAPPAPRRFLRTLSQRSPRPLRRPWQETVLPKELRRRIPAPRQPPASHHLSRRQLYRARSRLPKVLPPVGGSAEVGSQLATAGTDDDATGTDRGAGPVHDTLTGDSGIVTGALDAVAGEDGLLDSTLDVVAGDEGLLDTLTGDSGIVTGALGTVAGEDGLLDSTLDVVAGDEGLLGGLLGLSGAAEDQTSEDDFLASLLLPEGDDQLMGSVLDGLLGEDDPFALSPDDADASTLGDGTSALLAGLGIEDGLSGTLVDEGVVDAAAMDVEDSPEVDALLTEILGSSVDGDLFSSSQGAFDALFNFGDSEGDTMEPVAEGDDSLLGETAIDGTLAGLFESSSGDGLLSGLLSGDGDGLDSENS